MSNSEKPTLRKITFDLPKDAPVSSESVWAQDLGGGLFQVDNTPWYVKGYALGDVVSGRADHGGVRVERVVTASGNRTVRIFVPDGRARSEVKKMIYETLERLNCVYEGVAENKGLIAVTIPVNVKLGTVTQYLDQLEDGGLAFWESGNF